VSTAAKSDGAQSYSFWSTAEEFLASEADFVPPTAIAAAAGSVGLSRERIDTRYRKLIFIV
jgi:hypothetical protein